MNETFIHPLVSSFARMVLVGTEFVHLHNRIYHIETVGDRWVFIADVTEEYERLADEYE